MTNGPLHLVVFDYEGTLVDSHAGFHTAFSAAFMAIGRTPPEEAQTRALVGLPLREAVSRFIKDPDAKTLSTFSKAWQAARNFVSTGTTAPDTLIPGTRTVLETLEKGEVLMGIATNRSRRGLDESLKRHDIARFFVATRTADDAHAKPHPAMLEDLLKATGVEAAGAVMVGDTTTDMELARNAGVPAIGVSWGSQERDVLLKAGAVTVIDRYAELGNALRQVWLPEGVSVAG